jgi:chromatin structure-remodeling complex subunit RSC9
MWQHILADHLNETPTEDGNFKNRQATFTCAWGNRCTKYPQPTNLHLAQFMTHIKTHLKAEEARHLAADLTNIPIPAASPSKRGSVSTASAAQQHKPRVVRPAKTIVLAYEETASARDERNPNAPPQAAGIPLSAALILRNIARNVVKTKAEERLVKRRVERLENRQGGVSGSGGGREWVEYDGGREGGEEEEEEDGAGWNERLFRPVMPRLWEVFTENRLLAPYVTSLFQLLEREGGGLYLAGK